MTDDEGLRERKKRETRATLSQAAIRLCVQRGWDDVSLADIAEAANVSERTFRNYFTSKAEAIAATHLERALRTADELRARPAHEPLWDAVIAAVTAQFDGTTDIEPAAWPSGVRRVFAEPAVRGEILKANAAAQEALAVAIAERTGLDLERDVYPRLLASVVGAASGAAVGHWFRGGPRDSVVPHIHSALDQVRAGLPLPLPEADR
ncbi:MAG TPA: TetR/AcrR family transcriptional regulator [Pseudonocardiaceae bacterium]|jgi:AcrR family transcriptional regulator|nr:TetR/AcrR family transcriptional regulator [Pseudonocardiaceae bacterium]